MEYWVSVKSADPFRCAQWKGITYKNLDAAIRFAQRYAKREDIVRVWIYNDKNQIILTIK